VRVGSSHDGGKETLQWRIEVSALGEKSARGCRAQGKGEKWWRWRK
jgi:hypothetical protein